MPDHASTKVLIDSTPVRRVDLRGTKLAKVKPLLIDYRDLECGVEGTRLGTNYEEFLASGDPDYEWRMPSDEWNAVSLIYTSGTTRQSEGRRLSPSGRRSHVLRQHHRHRHESPTPSSVDPADVPLQRLVLPLDASVVAGTHVCLRAVRAKPMYNAIADHKVTHPSGAPFVMSALLNATESERRGFDHSVAFSHAAAPPPEAVLGAMADAGFELTHLYGLTETYGPATINEWHQEWDALPKDDCLAKRARQGVRYVALEGLDVAAWIRDHTRSRPTERRSARSCSAATSS